MHTALAFLALVSSALAASRTTAPAGAITVGQGATYTTLQAAINSLSTSATTAQSIFILAGTYKEQVTIPARKAALTIYGYTTDDTDYSKNQVSIEHSCSQSGCASTNDGTATLSNHAAATKFYNINIKNTYGAGSQAVALSAYATQQGYYGVGLYGYQDTLLAQTGKQVYAKCFIQGATDFIFGQYAVAWIDGSKLSVNGNGYITASGRSTNDASYYVINKSNVVADASGTAKAGGVYLGRPWRNYARVCFQNTALSSIINSAGWSVWSSSDPRTDSVTFQEYGNTGSGASGTRASFATKLSSALTIGTILGSDYASWVDTAYLS
ncbi:pectinesterase-1 [Coleophoma crateriformis]|uniref:Pectinesterase n=1 Tax=Coleophoma crateriformis TaxID=565419 RepID=A0A3D8T6W9_9HELO|nr:pectinesterase-1 [Coleophoma crateriformis]